MLRALLFLLFVSNVTYALDDDWAILAQVTSKQLKHFLFVAERVDLSEHGYNFLDYKQRQYSSGELPKNEESQNVDGQPWYLYGVPDKDGNNCTKSQWLRNSIIHLQRVKKEQPDDIMRALEHMNGFLACDVLQNKDLYIVRENNELLLKDEGSLFKYCCQLYITNKTYLLEVAKQKKVRSLKPAEYDKLDYMYKKGLSNIFCLREIGFSKKVPRSFKIFPQAYLKYRYGSYDEKDFLNN